METGGGLAAAARVEARRRHGGGASGSGFRLVQTRLASSVAWVEHRSRPETSRAAAASTVIGLTTGLFGTAQISALITLAESRGQAKTVATPRVTALNNRPAQIESGSQIPVQTTQAAAAQPW